jgi:hypothetical protein
MVNVEFSYKQYTDMTVGMRTQEERNLQVLRGKVLLNEAEKSLTFIQNKPEGPRSQEVMRTQHSRMVRKPDGNFTLTFRFSAGEKRVMERIVDEVTEISERLGTIGHKKGGRK